MFEGQTWNVVAGTYLLFSPEAAKVMCVGFLTLTFIESSTFPVRIYDSRKRVRVVLRNDKVEREEDEKLFSRRQVNRPQNLNDFVPYCTENLQDPYPWYKALRDESPIYKIPGFDYCVVSRYEDIQKICKNTKAFSSNLVSILLRGDRH